MRWFSLAVSVMMLLPANLQAQTPAASHLESYTAWHGPVLFSFEHKGRIVGEQVWTDVDTPRKFSLQLTMELASSPVWLMSFDLRGQSGNWWLEEVMGFLFDPMLDITSDVTDQGYDIFIVEMPGGAGTEPQTEVLMPGSGVSFRLTCFQCHRNGAWDDFMSLVNSITMEEYSYDAPSPAE